MEWGRLLTGREASGVYGIQMFSLRREQGRLAELAPVIRILAAESRSEGAWRPGLASVLVELGMEQELVTLSWNSSSHEVKGQRVVIGRSRDCDIQLADANVSRRHAELRQEGASYWIVDLGSTNGLEVNGKRVKRAKLHSGDTITLGSTELKFARESE